MAVPPEEGGLQSQQVVKERSNRTRNRVHLFIWSTAELTLSSSEEHQAMPAHRLPDKSKACSHVVIAYHSQQIITLILS